MIILCISLYYTSPVYFFLSSYPLLLLWFLFFSSPPKTCASLHFTPLFLLPSLLSSSPTLQAGKIPPNSTVGRLLMEMVSRVPKIEGPKFDSMLNATMQASNTFYVYNKLSSLGFRPLFADVQCITQVAILCRNWRLFHYLFQIACNI